MSKVHRLSRYGSTFINYINGSAKALVRVRYSQAYNESYKVK